MAGKLTAPTPTISGSALVGSTLSANPGTWGPAPVALTYQWKANGVAISGATAKTFIVTPTQVGKTITVTVTGKKTALHDGQSHEPRDGQGSGAGAVTGTDTDDLGQRRSGAAPLRRSRAHGVRRRSRSSTSGCGTALVISGATSVTYVIPSADIGDKLSVRVVGSKKSYPSLTRTSAQTAAIAAKPFGSAPTPTITGTLRVANTLTAHPGTWSPAATDFDYQWYRSGTAIPGATGKTWLLNGADYNDKITVRVTAKRSLYATTSRTSAATTAILPGLHDGDADPVDHGHGQGRPDAQRAHGAVAAGAGSGGVHLAPQRGAHPGCERRGRPLDLQAGEGRHRRYDHLHRGEHQDRLRLGDQDDGATAKVKA